MSKWKRVACAVLCVLMLTVAAAGCSTPENAMTVNGEDVTTGEYLANLYNIFYQMYYNQGLYYYEQYGQDVWGQSYTYGEGDATQKLVLDDYIKQIAQDAIVRQKAVASLMGTYGITLTAELQEELDTQMESVSNSTFLQYGFNKESYRKMTTAYYYNEQALFYGLYDEGGQRAIPEKDIRAYFDKNYLTYKIIEISLVDSDGNALDEEEIAEIMEQLEGYLAIYNETGDFDKAIEQYTEDSDTSSTTTTTGSETTTTASGENTTAETTTTTAKETTTTAGGETTTTTDASTTTTGSDEEEEEEADPNLVELVAEKASDQELVKAIQSVEEGTAKIVTYNKGGTKNTAALILRLDPEGEGREDYYEEKHDNVIYNMKWDEYDAEVKELIATYTVEVNQKAIKMCDPKSFLDD